MKFSIFCSYSTKDFDVVHKFQKYFETKGYLVWIDRDKLLFGDYLDPRILDQLQSSNFIFVFNSKNSIDSRWVIWEIFNALNFERESGIVKIIPIKLDEQKISKYLRGRVYFDAYDNLDNTLSDLEKTISIYTKSPRKIIEPNPSIISPFKNTQIIDLMTAGKYYNSYIQAESFYRKNLLVGDHINAAIFLSTMINVQRALGKFTDALKILYHNINLIDYCNLPLSYQIKILKEKLVIHHEMNNIKEAVKTLHEIELIDPKFKLHPTEDNWLPGVLLWRKAHLQYLFNNSNIDESVVLSRESINYYLDKDLSQTSGYASALLNTGWLLYLNNSEESLNFFRAAKEVGDKLSPRTFSEAQIGEGIAELKFHSSMTINSIVKIIDSKKHLAELGSAKKNYSFLGDAKSPISIISRHIGSLNSKLKSDLFEILRNHSRENSFGRRIGE